MRNYRLFENTMVSILRQCYQSVATSMCRVRNFPCNFGILPCSPVGPKTKITWEMRIGGGCSLSDETLSSSTRGCWRRCYEPWPWRLTTKRCRFISIMFYICCCNLSTRQLLNPSICLLLVPALREYRHNYRYLIPRLVFNKSSAVKIFLHRPTIRSRKRVVINSRWFPN